MTRLIGEPSDKRDISNHDYRVRQLERRPAPITTQTIPLFRGLQTTGNFQTLGNDVDVLLLWSDWENLDTTVFDSNLSGGLLQSVDLLLPGVYYLSCAVYIQALSAGGAVVRMSDGWEVADFYSHTFKGNVTGGGAFLFSVVRSFSPYRFFTSESGINEPPYGRITWYTSQNTGISRNTQFGTHFEIGYLGGFSEGELSS